MGGGGRTFTNVTFNGLAFPSTGVSADTLSAENENGRYQITDRAGQEFTIRAFPSGGANYIPAANAGEVGSGGDTEITALVGPSTFQLGEEGDIE